MEQAVKIVLLGGLGIICLLGLAYLYISVAEYVLKQRTVRQLQSTKAKYIRKTKPVLPDDWDDVQVRMR